MARAIWKGSISFGLVNIPVSLTCADSRPDMGSVRPELTKIIEITEFFALDEIDPILFDNHLSKTPH